MLEEILLLAFMVLGDNMKDAAKNIVGGISSGLNEMWEQIKGWGKTTGQQLASGIGDAWWQIKRFCIKYSWRNSICF